MRWFASCLTSRVSRSSNIRKRRSTSWSMRTERFVIPVLAKASAWPTLRNRVVDWASGENGPEPKHVHSLLIAMRSPSEH